MPLKKSTLAILAILLFLTAFVATYFLLDFIFGSSFEIKSWYVSDNKGLPAIFCDCSSFGYIVIKTFDSNSNLVDTDISFTSSGEKAITLGQYGKTVSGNYIIKAYRKEGEEIFSKTFSFRGPSLSIHSTNQNWWSSNEKAILVGLDLYVKNNGDTPAYPYYISIETQSGKKFQGYVVPTSVNPNEMKTIYCTVYIETNSSIERANFTISDREGYTLAFSSFTFDIRDNVDTKYFYFETDGNKKTLTVPYPEILFNYYSNLERIDEEDYSYYVFDPYDDLYLDLFIDRLISTLDFGKLQFDKKTDSDKINFIARFVQGIEYREDPVINGSREYPKYPLETLFDLEKGRDCEDKAILTASLLDRLGYEVALFRLQEHMAVGVKLDRDAVYGYDYYYEDYFYLETTTEGARLGFVPSQYKDNSNLKIYRISNRPYLTHKWVDNVLTIYTNTKYGNFVKLDTIVENYGRAKAENIIVKGVFVTNYGFEISSNSFSIPSLDANEKIKITILVEIPSFTTRFESRIIYNGEIVSKKESSKTFPI